MENKIYFKKGQKAWWLCGGALTEGIIKKIDTTEQKYKIIFQFTDQNDGEFVENFTEDGKFSTNDIAVTLFQRPFDIPKNIPLDEMMFNVGDRVESMIHGFGTVIWIDEARRNPIMVEFNNDPEHYLDFTKEGRFNELDHKPILRKI